MINQTINIICNTIALIYETVEIPRELMLKIAIIVGIIVGSIMAIMMLKNCNIEKDGIIVTIFLAMLAFVLGGSLGAIVITAWPITIILIALILIINGLTRLNEKSKDWFKKENKNNETNI